MRIRTIQESVKDSSEGMIKDEGTKKAVRYTKALQQFILCTMSAGETFDNDVIASFIATILKAPKWKKLVPANPDSKGILLEHEQYGKFASGMVDEEGRLILDQDGIPKHFSFHLRTGGNIVRGKSGNLTFTGGFKKK